MSDWTKAPPGITAWSERHNSPSDWDQRSHDNIRFTINATGISLYVTVPAGSGYRDVFFKITADRLADLSIAQQAEVMRAKDAEIAELKARAASEIEKAATLADKLYAIKEQIEDHDIWVPMHAAEERWRERANAEFQAEQRAKQRAARRAEAQAQAATEQEPKP